MSSFSPSVPPNSRSRYAAVRRTSQLGELISCCTDSRPSAPNPIRMSRSRRRDRASCSLDRASASGVITAVPIAWHSALEALVAFVVGAAQVRGHVLHHRRRGRTARARRGRAAAARADGRLIDDRFGELPRLVEVADPHEIVGVAHDGLRDVAPAQRVRLDDEQVEQQVVIEPAQRAVADGRQPRRDALRRIVARAFDRRPRASWRSRARARIRSDTKLSSEDQVSIPSTLPHNSEND